jgi:hypothetical protein
VKVFGFEYKVVRLPDHIWEKQEELLNTLGADGWELVAVLEGLAYLRIMKITAPDISSPF